jgi:hypothetical protein
VAVLRLLFSTQSLFLSSSITVRTASMCLDGVKAAEVRKAEADVSTGRSSVLQILEGC